MTREAIETRKYFVGRSQIGGKSDVHSSLIGVLATYAVACFVVLQMLDIVQEPLGLPVAAIRWVVLFIFLVAPVLVLAVAWNSRRNHLVSSDAGIEAGQSVVLRFGHADAVSNCSSSHICWLARHCVVYANDDRDTIAMVSLSPHNDLIVLNPPQRTESRSTAV
jgi:hypothetical protein